jgi:uncharacterized lipoprotein YddW (UPF0748 family)
MPRLPSVPASPSAAVRPLRGPVLALIVACALWPIVGAASAAEEVRAIWVVRTTLASPASIAAMISAAEAGGFNTVFVQARGRGDAFYRSSIEPRPNALAAQPESFDPLGLVVELAHRAGIRVHAWFNVNLVADISDMPASPRHLIYRHPEWLMLPRELVGALGRLDPRNASYLARLTTWTRGQSGAVEGLYASPISERAADHVVTVATELVARYPVDGLHLDYARYPGRTFDYSREALEAFQQVVSREIPRSVSRSLERESRRDPLAFVDRYPERWQEFRRLRLTALVRRVHAAIRDKRPGTLVSVAVVPDATEAASAHLQEWRIWLDQRLIDAICPMAYTTNAALFKAQIDSARLVSSGLYLWAGIGAYRLTPEQTLKNISVAREAGADGFALFSYDALLKSPNGADTLARIGRAASGQ